MAIRVIVIEGHLLALRGISAELDEIPDIQLVAALSGGMQVSDLMELVQNKNPHLAVLDLSLKVACLDPFEAVPALKERYPELDIVALVGREDVILIRWLVAHKVMGCLFSDDEQIESLGAVVHKVAEGKLAYSQEIVERYFHLSDLTLTPRELDVLYLAGEGLSNCEIANRLSISPVTVRNHLSNVYAKLGIPQDARWSPRVCAVKMARELGVLGMGMGAKIE
jgi:DNA-binding NarL/FixJ family response regulator